MDRLARLLLLGALLAPACASAHLADLQVYDRTDQRYLTIHEHRGQRYVAGELGHEYEIRLRNDSSGRLLAVTSVDGVNVVSGETASPSQSGYVLAPYQDLAVEGWRKSLGEVAAFYFTRLPDSYAARTGRPFDVGVIGVALFREKQRCCEWFGRREDDERSRDSAAEAQGAPSAAVPEARAKAEDGLSSKESPLGTGHGRRERSDASYTAFERASDTPDEILAIRYDSRDDLVAQGVLPSERRYAWRGPRPFPGSFVPDP